jgi:hypothetical protein
MPIGMISMTRAYLERRPCICIELAPFFISLPPIVEVILGLRVDMKDVRMNIAFGGEGYPAGSLVNGTNVVSEV